MPPVSAQIKDEKVSRKRNFSYFPNMPPVAAQIKDEKVSRKRNFSYSLNRHAINDGMVFFGKFCGDCKFPLEKKFIEWEFLYTKSIIN